MFTIFDIVRIIVATISCGFLLWMSIYVMKFLFSRDAEKEKIRQQRKLEKKKIRYEENLIRKGYHKESCLLYNSKGFISLGICWKKNKDEEKR
jgi:hypothetical protein